MNVNSNMNTNLFKHQMDNQSQLSHRERSRNNSQIKSRYAQDDDNHEASLDDQQSRIKF